MEKNLNYTGIVEIDVIEDGQYVRTISINNILTYGGQYCILHAIGNSNNSYISRAIFGDGTTLKAVTNTIGSFTNYEYVNTNFTKPTSSTLSSQLLQVAWNLPLEDFNGKTIKEIGLTFISNNSNENLFCRVTLDAGDQIVKTPNIQLNGIWKITVTES